MTVTPTTLPIHGALPEGRRNRAASGPRQGRFSGALDLFLLCRRLALYTDTGREPPRWLLDELGVQKPD
jgi:hypothetical protein